MTIVRTLLAKLGVKVDKSGFGKADSGIKRMKQGLGSIAQQAKGATSGIQGMVAAIAGFSAAKGLIDTNVEAQKLGAQLKAVTGSAEAGKEAFAFIKDFAQTTPFELNNVTQAFIKLKAGGIEPTAETMKAVGDLAAANSTTIAQAASAITKANKGLVEEAGSQLNIAGRVTAKTVEFTVQGVEHTVKRGGQNISDFLLDVGKTKFAGAMSDQMETVGGKLSNLSDATTAFKVAIGEAGLNQAVVRLVASLIDWTNASNGLAVSLGRTLGSAVDSLGASLEFLGRNAEEAKIATMALGSAFLAIKLSGFIASLGAALAPVVVLIKSAVAGLKVAFSAIRAIGAAGLSMLILKLSAIVGLVLGIVDGMGGVQGLMQSLQEIGAAILDGITEIGQAFAESFGQIFQALKRGIMEPFREIGVVIGKIIKSLIGPLSRGIRLVASIVSAIVKTIAEIIVVGIDVIGAFLKPVIEIIKTIMALVWGVIGIVVSFVENTNNPVLKWLVGVVKMIGEAISDIKTGWSLLSSFIRDSAASLFNPMIKGLGSFVSYLKSVISAIPDVFLTDDLKEFAESDTDFELIKTSKEVEADMTREAAIASADQALADIIGTGFGNQANVQSLNVNIMGNPNGSPSEVGRAAQQGTQQALEDITSQLGDVSAVEF